MKQHTYKAFGLNIISDIELPELLIAEGNADVEIRLGEIEEVDRGLTEDIIIKTSPEEIIYQLKDIAGCKVQNGKKVIIMPKLGLNHTILRLFVLTSVLGCILIQRKIPAIHGSSVVIGDQCIIIAGNSGAGKSTITNEFILKGHSFLSDDVSVINYDQLERMYVQPGHPFRKLHKDSAQHYCLNIENCERIEYEEDKYLIPVHDSFIDRPIRLNALVEIVPKEVDAVSIQKLSGIEKLNVLMENLYRGRLTSHFNSKAYYFKMIGSIAANLKVYRLTRPNNKFTCDKQVELIMNEVLNYNLI